MFSSGINTTQSSLEGLTKAGYLQEQEVTQQGDGSEWVTGEDGEQVPFSSLGNGVSSDEIQSGASSSKIPFLDTSSPWNKAIPVDKKEEFLANATKAVEEQGVLEKDEKTSTTTKTDSKKMKELVKQRKMDAKDPIEALTVARLKEVLKSNGLKLAGNKKELQARLRAHVSSMMLNQTDDDKGNGD
jgi:hypothetical protein